MSNRKEIINKEVLLFKKMKDCLEHEASIHKVQTEKVNEMLANDNYGIKDQEYNDRYNEVNASNANFDRMVFDYISVSGFDNDTEAAYVLKELIKLVYLDKDLFTKGIKDYEELNDPDNQYYHELYKKYRRYYRTVVNPSFCYYIIDCMGIDIPTYIRTAINSGLNVKTARYYKPEKGAYTL